MAWEWRPQQNKSENEHNEKRIKKIVADCKGDKDKEIKKATTMANKITTPEKAYDRAYTARQLGYEHLFEVFYQRAYALGSVTIAEHRDHMIDQILKDDDE